ncbi:MAG: molybdenum ABC transporter ATP-binding protein [Gammaproteobacteria bacterium]|nr:molybdenum ABC transporter ATP-binding protein [Gammaproteobacteria bacterium]
MSSFCRIWLLRKEFSVEAEFSIPEKGVLGIYGQSGSGKTTILRCIAGLEHGAKGSIEVNGEVWLSDKKNLSSQQRNIGYVFQDGRLFPHLTVSNNLEYGASRRSRDKTKFAAETGTAAADRDHLLELLNIGHLLTRYPHQLSGGEKQRVAIGRALLKKPRLLLLDEPLASLDENRKQEILPYLQSLHEELNVPMLYVSHNMGEMLSLCDYLLIIEKGKIKFKGYLHDALVSAESPLATVDRAAAVLEGVVSKQEKNFDISTVHTVNGNQFQIPGLITIGKRVRLIIYASDVSVAKNKAIESSILNIIEGRVSAVLDQSNGRVLLQINCNQDIVLSLVSVKSFQRLALSVNSTVFIQVKAVVTQRA